MNVAVLKTRHSFTHLCASINSYVYFLRIFRRFQPQRPKRFYFFLANPDRLKSKSLILGLF